MSETDPAAKATPADLGYAAAIDELEAILAELDDDDLDVDVLASRVERAAVLITLCRGRIRDAQLKVERVVADLNVADLNVADPHVTAEAGAGATDDDSTLFTA